MPEYYLLGTTGCHLCEQAEQLLHQSSYSPNYQTIDIVENSQWYEKYSALIPVLYHPVSQQQLQWPFDEILLQQFFETCHQL